MGPLNWLDWSRNSNKFSPMLPSVYGMLPVSWLADKSKYVKEVNPKSTGGMVPCNPLPARFKLVIGPEHSLVLCRENHRHTGSDADIQLSVWDHPTPFAEKYKDAK